ncbi:hypothetical protein C463_07367 [Halorubrum californiense DSM 19288]|uniref:Uncharacterized protein n=1 Tax=Halorubrum californiense DSM 19288 TaxID=1227465 RepID=M0EAC5_9EURY|nr:MULTISPECIES: hypothetical protein [Halorubrum]ELZ44756.1 hypothetical protein C463_07367 [Halorubrum californiense DSM 19288]
MTVPLRHFLVGLGLLGAALLVGVGLVVDAMPGLGGLVHVHLFLVGWVCVTIMGAMTQFAPVWSGTTLHSRRLASAQLALVVGGLVGFATALALGRLPWLAGFGAVMLLGFWAFVYNLGRTLATVDDFDVTERHFVAALGFFVALTGLGVLLAADLGAGLLADSGVSHAGVRGAHVTLAVFGAVLTTVYGALYRLGTMFTQTELHGVDHRLRAVEEVGHPVGVVALAGGRLVGATALARVGAALILLAALGFAVVLARRLYEMRVERTPMHSRYAVVALAAWVATAAPAWLRSPTAPDHVLGGPGSAPLLLLGVVGFVIVGTLYHIVPFGVWVERYSDRLGFEAVPMIDDLYDDRLAAADGTLLSVGTALVVAADLLAGASGTTLAGGLRGPALAGTSLVTLGVAVFAASAVWVIRRHSPGTLRRVALGRFDRREASGSADAGDGGAGGGSAAERSGGAGDDPAPTE